MVFEDESSDSQSSLVYVYSSSSDGIASEEKNNLEANYDKLVEDVHQLFNAQEDRMMDFSYLQSKMNNTEVSNSVVSDMRTEIEKKDAEIFKLQEKYEVLMNITKAQGTVIQNLKLNHLKEKEKLI
nr:uncharacterized protein LOC109760252 [Aegilops tauschii subsp. strangulata]